MTKRKLKQIGCLLLVASTNSLLGMQTKSKNALKSCLQFKEQLMTLEKPSAQKDSVALSLNFRYFFFTVLPYKCYLHV